jgi:N-acetylglutamate synthase-like GNAT family acetyltransferase
MRFISAHVGWRATQPQAGNCGKIPVGDRLHPALFGGIDYGRKARDSKDIAMNPGPITGADKPRKVRVGLFERLTHLLRGPNPLNPAVWEGRLKPMTFRRLENADIPHCLDIYKLNEQGRFPDGFIVHYQKSLADPASYFLVGEIKGQIVATGGLQYYARDDFAVLSFGLVHPEHHNNGIGAALFLSRMSLLNTTHEYYNLLILAVQKSIDYYRRFGFQDCESWKDDRGRAQPSGILNVKSDEILRCRLLLRDHGILVPRDQSKIPLREPPAPSEERADAP